MKKNKKPSRKAKGRKSATAEAKSYGCGLSGILGQEFELARLDPKNETDFKVLKLVGGPIETVWPRTASLAEKNVDYLLNLVRVPLAALNNMQIAMIVMQLASMFATMLRVWSRAGKLEATATFGHIVREEMKPSSYLVPKGAEDLSNTIAWQVTIPEPDGYHHGSRRIGPTSILALLVDGRFVVLDFSGEGASLVMKKQRIAATPKDLAKIFVGRDPIIKRVLLTMFFPHITERLVIELDLKRRALDGFQSRLTDLSQKLDLTGRHE